jgi:hypothetical protein
LTIIKVLTEYYALSLSLSLSQPSSSPITRSTSPERDVILVIARRSLTSKLPPYSPSLAPQIGCEPHSSGYYVMVKPRDNSDGNPRRYRRLVSLILFCLHKIKTKKVFILSTYAVLTFVAASDGFRMARNVNTQK